MTAEVSPNDPIILTPANLIYRGRVAARPPFSLPLTVAVLIRRPTNLVDLLDEQGVYARAFVDERGAWLVQAAGDGAGFDLSVYGTANEPGGEYWAALVGRTLGVGVDLSGFYERAAQVPGLDELAVAMVGVKPPRYPSLWEALTNAIIFQQVSIESAMAIMRRFIMRFSRPVLFAGATYYPFPDPNTILAATADELRAVGCSAAKARALLAAARPISNGAISLAALEQMPNDQVIATLTTLPGIGPWTAIIVLLRGLGRLDVFPPADSGAALGLRGLFGFERAALDTSTAEVLAILGTYKGLLYYHLLLWRLRERGQLAGYAL